MTADISESISRSANDMIRIHGTNALSNAHMEMIRMVTIKDDAGQRMWQAIARSIEEKQRPLGP